MEREPDASESQRGGIEMTTPAGPGEGQPEDHPEWPGEQDIALETECLHALGRLLALGHLLLCIVWLGPAIVLLILNFRGHIIGASIGCFSCYLNPFSNATFEEKARLDRKDRDILGALQLAAKAMEIIFIAVVSGILYDAMILVVAKGGDFPIGLLRRYFQFMDPRSIGDYPKGRKTKRHHAFIIFAGFLCFLVNLIGPATATLLLPTLQWRDEAIRSLGLFNKMASDMPPRNTDIAADCTKKMLDSGNYSCTEKPYADSLDQLFASLSGSLEQIGQTEIIFDPVITQERQVSFIVNTTDRDIDWIPSRQVAREVSDEYVRYANGVDGNRKSNYTRLSNSLSTTLLRDGPTLGLAGGCYRGVLSIATIATDKSIRCFGGWTLYAEPGSKYVRCIRVGDGWKGSTNIHSRFHLGDEGSTAGPITADVYFADKVYTSVPDDDPQCFIDSYPQTNPGCNWDKVFLANPPPPRVQNTSTNIIIVEYTVPNFSSTNRTIWCDNIVYLGFQNYSMDPNPFSNFIHLTQLYSHVQADTTPLVVDTNWILAGWSVNRNGTVDGTRIAARTMIRILKDALQDNAEKLDLSTLNYMDGVAANQGLSMIDYSINSTITTNNQAAVLTSGDYRQLRTSVKIHVWAYGLGSRTSMLGTIVVIIGSTCVLLRTFTILWRVKVGYTPMKPLKELLIEALEYVPEYVPVQGIEERNIRASIPVAGTKVSFLPDA